MKIDLINIGDDSESQYGNVLLIKNSRGKVVPDFFVVDTGSPKTVVPYDKALRLNLPFTRKFSRIIALGGSKYKAYEITNLEFIMSDNNGNKIVEPFPCLVLKPTSEKKEKELGHFPVIIGMDF